MNTLLKTAYQKIHSRLPAGFGEIVSDLVFRLANKPFVYVDPSQRQQRPLRRGAVVFSIDFEMAWAWQYAATSREAAVVKGMRERSRIPLILQAFNDHAMPATWATVGHLFLHECARNGSGVAHPELPRPEHFENNHWEFTEGDWYQHDPCSDVDRAPAWYAPDLIEAILASGTKHEIACHGFSHLGFGPYCPPAVADAELDACLAAMKRYGLRPTSLVYPGNECGHRDIVEHKGFTAIRWHPIPWADITLPMNLGRTLWGLHMSACVEARPTDVSIARRLARLYRYIDKAIETNMVASLWFHPDFHPTVIRQLLRPLLQYCANRREEARLDVMTMAELVAAMEASGRGEIATPVGLSQQSAGTV